MKHGYRNINRLPLSHADRGLHQSSMRYRLQEFRNILQYVLGAWNKLPWQYPQNNFTLQCKSCFDTSLYLGLWIISSVLELWKTLLWRCYILWEIFSDCKFQSGEILKSALTSFAINPWYINSSNFIYLQITILINSNIKLKLINNNFINWFGFG